MSHAVEVILGLLLAVAALALISRRVGIPYPILLVLGGLGIASIPGLPQIRLNPDLVFFIFLPPLLYPAALFTSWRDFRANLRPISLLAVGLVLFTTVSVGYLAHYLIPEFPLAAGFVLGAIISPPDAIAATAITAHLPIPRRIITILDGESLVNDATALVAFRFGVAAVVTGAFSLSQAAGQFLIVVGGGLGIGLAVGFIATWIHQRIEDPPVEITLSLLAPYAAYLLAERLHVSGILSVVVTGLYQGWRVPESTSARTRLQARPVWEIIEFILNGFVFLLIGLQLREVIQRLAGQSLITLLSYGAAISSAVILLRIVWVFPATYLPRILSSKLRQRDPSPPWQWVAIVGWTGIRGVVSLAAALALPLDTQNGARFPARDLILFLTFVVILFTLVVQGLSLPPLIRWLGVEDDHAIEREERQARIKANQAALARLVELADSRPEAINAIDRLRGEYDDRLRQLNACEEVQTEDLPASVSHYEHVLSEALRVERAVILQLRNELAINDEVWRRIQRDIDLAEARYNLASR